MRLQQFSHFFAEISHSRIETIQSSFLLEHGLQLHVKRDDVLHKVISGNKWRKLKHLLLHIEASGFKKVAAMGGAYSNLLHALAYICYRLEWPLELFVRGYPEQVLSPTLQDALDWGASIRYVNREEFRQIRNHKPVLADDVFWIPEGGFHRQALLGVAELLMEIPNVYDYIVMASATGASLAGLATGIAKTRMHSQIIGISVLNNAEQAVQDIESLIDSRVKSPKLISGYEFGGYAKSSARLDTFIEDMNIKHGLPLEPVYSGKSCYAVFDLIKNDYFPRGSRILLIHCGGLQGKRKTERLR